MGVRPNRHYTESNAWQYIWSVQHDVDGLISLFGSSDRFNRKLDTFFEMDPAISGPKYIGVVGTIGQYVHGNQPSHHVAYLYNYSGEPWKTQYWTRQICEQLYRPGPGGLCGPCRGRLPAIRQPYCPRCGRQVHGAVPVPFDTPCGGCRVRPPR